MDIITHSLAGAALARTGFQEPLGAKRATWAAVVASNVADLDIVQMTFQGYEAYIFDHRGITHSLVGWLVATALLTGLFRAIWRDVRIGPLALLIGLAYGAHIFMDVPTSWGTMLWLPFDDARVALDWVFIVDVVIWAIFILPWFFRKGLGEKLVFRAAFVVLGLYYVFCGVAHGVAEASLELTLDHQQIPARIACLNSSHCPGGAACMPDRTNPETGRRYERCDPGEDVCACAIYARQRVIPAPFAPFFWTAVAHDQKNAYVMHLALPLVGVNFDKILVHNLHHPAVVAFKRTKKGQRLFWWLRAPQIDLIPLDNNRLRLQIHDLAYYNKFLEKRSLAHFRYNVLMEKRDGRWVVLKNEGFH